MHLSYGRTSYLIYLEVLSQSTKQHALESEGASKPVCCFLHVTESGKVTGRIRMSPCPSLVWNPSYHLHPPAVEASGSRCVSSWGLIYLVKVVTYLSETTYMGKIYLGFQFLGHFYLPWRSQHGAGLGLWWRKHGVDFSHVSRERSRKCTLELKMSITFKILHLWLDSVGLHPLSKDSMTFKLVPQSRHQAFESWANGRQFQINRE